MRVAGTTYYFRALCGGICRRCGRQGDSGRRCGLIVKELAAIGPAIEDIPEESAVWRSLRAAPVTLLLGQWCIEYLVDEKRNRFLILSVAAR